MRPKVGNATVAAILAVATSVSAHATEIAGLHPDRRPASAPVITSYSKDSAWYAEALKGIEQPYPASLRFLEDQANWFTPFKHPGAEGPYDIRGWYQSETP